MSSVNFIEDHCSETNKRYQLTQSKANFHLKEGYMQRNHRYITGEQPSKYWYTEEKQEYNFKRVKSVLLSGFLVEITGAENICQFRILCLTEIPFISEDEIKVF